MKGHPKAGQETFFVEKTLNSLCVDFRDVLYWCFLTGTHPGENFGALSYPIESKYYDSLCDNISDCKHHTIRAGKRWKDGDMASLRAWSGKPYGSKQITIASDVKLTVKEIDIYNDWNTWIDGELISRATFETLAKNDGLDVDDMLSWFGKIKPHKIFSGQLLIWNNTTLPY
jgi:hypothetical protein